MSNIVIEQYTYASLVSEAKNRKKHSNCSSDAAREGSYDFTQTESFEESVEFAVNGWDLGLEQYKIQEGILVGGSTEIHASLAGSMPHIQNHIMGFPQQMYQLFDNREYNLPTLDIIVNLAYSAYIKGEDALDFGKSLVAYINKKASTNNIRITGIFCSNQSKNVEAYQMITLKDFDSALVLNNIAFAFHPSFFRRIWFSVLEGKSYWRAGYGSTVEDYKSVALENLQGSKSDEVIAFKTLNDINDFKWDESIIDKVIF